MVIIMPELVGVTVEGMRRVTDAIVITVKALVAAPVVAGNSIIPGRIAPNVLDDVVEVVGDYVLLDAIIANGEVKMKRFGIVADCVVEDFTVDAGRFGIGVDVEGFGIEAQVVASDGGMSLSCDEDSDPSRSATAEDAVVFDAGFGRPHRHDTGCVADESVVHDAGTAAVFDQCPVSALADGVIGKEGIRGKGDLDIPYAGNGVAGDTDMTPVPDFECVPSVGDRLTVGGDDIVGNVGIANLVEIDAIEGAFEAAMAHRTVVHSLHPNRSIEGDGLLSTVGDSEVFQRDIGASDCDDRSMTVPFDPGLAGYADESEGFVNVEIPAQHPGRETDHRTDGGLVDRLLERLGVGCGDDEEK